MADAFSEGGKLCSMTASIRVTVGGSICAGDCDGNGGVEVDELVRGVNVALGIAAPDRCPAADASGNGTVTLDEIVRAVRAALHGC